MFVGFIRFAFTNRHVKIIIIIILIVLIKINLICFGRLLLGRLILFISVERDEIKLPGIRINTHIHKKEN